MSPANAIQFGQWKGDIIIWLHKKHYVEIIQILRLIVTYHDTLLLDKAVFSN